MHVVPIVDYYNLLCPVDIDSGTIRTPDVPVIFIKQRKVFCTKTLYRMPL
jgi:hypothetical protein